MKLVILTCAHIFVGGECDAILGSVKALTMGSQVMYIPLIVMEWVFVNPKMVHLCGVTKIEAMTKVFHEAGYIPFTNNRLKRLDPRNSVKWPEMNTMEWIHRDSMIYQNIAGK